MSALVKFSVVLEPVLRQTKKIMEMMADAKAGCRTLWRCARHCKQIRIINGSEKSDAATRKTVGKDSTTSTSRAKSNGCD